jgi:hypothetical protein
MTEPGDPSARDRAQVSGISGVARCGGCPAHAELAVAVAYELGFDLDGTDEALAALARELDPADAFTELESVRALCGAFAAGPALLLPDVLRARAGEPAGVTLAVAAAAERAGLAIDVVAGRTAGDAPAWAEVPSETLFLAHPDTPLIVEASGRLLDGRTLGVDLQWRCAHETAATILDLLAARAERTGDLALAIAARALTLPLEDDSRAFRAREHARLLARLN